MEGGEGEQVPERRRCEVAEGAGVVERGWRAGGRQHSTQCEWW
jgi:hypothetical protein